MKGRIYSDDRCPVCGGVFKSGDKGLSCPTHPQCFAQSFKVYYPPTVWRRFLDYSAAARFLNALRYQADQGTFDPRDYHADNPLGFETLACQYIEIKKGQVKHVDTIRRHLYQACDYFGQRNIKTITYADLEDFLLGQNPTAQAILGRLSDKSRFNIKATLHAFFLWVARREKRNKARFEMPEFPEIKYTLGWRRLVDKDTQQAIIEEVKRISWGVNPKIYIGIKWLSIYIAIRPGELLNIQEEDFNLAAGLVLIRSPKEGKPKIVPLLDEDIHLVQTFPTSIGNPYFFRHSKRSGSVMPGAKFGRAYLWSWWRKACANLSIAGVDLYGGTRHSTATALGQTFTPEQIKQATLHSTNKAFERYFQQSVNDLRKLYAHAADKFPTRFKQSSPDSQIVDFIKKQQ